MPMQDNQGYNQVLLDLGVRSMLDKLFGKKAPQQSQTVGNVTTNGGQVAIAVVVQGF